MTFNGTSNPNYQERKKTKKEKLLHSKFTNWASKGRKARIILQEICIDGLRSFPNKRLRETQLFIFFML